MDEGSWLRDDGFGHEQTHSGAGGGHGPLRAQQVVVPVLAVSCYEVESDVLRMLVYYILSLMSVNSPADSVLRAAFCHYPENYITLMEYYDPAEHGMEAYTGSLHKGIAQNQKPGTLFEPFWPQKDSGFL